MRCEECLPSLEEFLDGELAEKPSARMSAHLELCLACAAQLEQLANEQQAFQRYQREVDLPSTAWSVIQNRIAEADADRVTRAPQVSVLKPASNRYGWLEVFALPRFSLPVSAVLVLLAVICTVAIMKYFDQAKPKEPELVARSNEARALPNPAPEVKPDERPPESASQAGEKVTNTSAPARIDTTRKKSPAVAQSLKGTPEQLVREAEAKYLSAIALLTKDVRRHPSEIDPETRSRLDGALASIDRTISATRNAVHQNPNDPIAVQYMLAAYRKKVDVLREMTSY